MSPNLVTLVLLTLLVTGCGHNEYPAICLPYCDMREGDLAFRCGSGIFSRAVSSVGQEGNYSHVGILISDSGKWKVVHAVPGEKEFSGDFSRVKNDPIEVFFTPSRASKGCLAHAGILDTEVLNNIHNMALRYVRDSVRFDDKYDLYDSTKVYCTEFVWLLYREQGIDLSEGRRRFIGAFNIHEDCILPEHILAYSNNIFYYKF